MKRLPMTMYIGLFVAAMAAPSFAADLPRPSYKAPIYSVPGFSWTGFYLGATAGYGFGSSDWSNATTTGNPKPKGFVGGGTIGYNLQTGSWVWGLEADLSYSGMKNTETGTGLCAAPGCETANSWLATGRGRLGYAGWDRWLPYITGGAAYGDVKMTRSTGASETENKLGWTLGAGVEYALMSNWSAKIEYLYADLGTATCAAATCGVDTDVTFKANIVRLGVNYRF